MMKYNLSVVTLTYGDRFDYVRQLVNECISQGVSEIYIYDNASSEENHNLLADLCALHDNVFLKYSPCNLGSAGGYNKALKWVRDSTNCDFIWMLDDDNIPSEKSVHNLYTAWDLMLLSKNDALVSYRKITDGYSNIIDKPALKFSIEHGYILGQKEGLYLKLYRKLKSNNDSNNIVNYPIVKRLRASYGGLFFKTELLDKIGYPREDFYLYGDDFEFSDRIVNNGGDIFTCYHSQIIDIDSQVGVDNFFSDKKSLFKLYYSIRNHIYLDFYNKPVRCALYFLAILILNLKSFSLSRKYLKRVRIIIKAIHHGCVGKLGKLTDGALL